MSNGLLSILIFELDSNPQEIDLLVQQSMTLSEDSTLRAKLRAGARSLAETEHSRAAVCALLTDAELNEWNVNSKTITSKIVQLKLGATCPECNKTFSI